MNRLIVTIGGSVGENLKVGIVSREVNWNTKVNVGENIKNI